MNTFIQSLSQKLVIGSTLLALSSCGSERVSLVEISPIDESTREISKHIDDILGTKGAMKVHARHPPSISDNVNSKFGPYKTITPVRLTQGCRDKIKGLFQENTIPVHTDYSQENSFASNSSPLVVYESDIKDTILSQEEARIVLDPTRKLKKFENSLYASCTVGEIKIEDGMKTPKQEQYGEIFLSTRHADRFRSILIKRLQEDPQRAFDHLKIQIYSTKASRFFNTIVTYE